MATSYKPTKNLKIPYINYEDLTEFFLKKKIEMN